MAEKRTFTPQQILDIIIAKLQSMTPVQIMVEEFESDNGNSVISIEIEYEPD